MDKTNGASSFSSSSPGPYIVAKKELIIDFENRDDVVCRRNPRVADRNLNFLIYNDKLNLFVEIDRFFESSERLPGEIVSPEQSQSLECASELHTLNSEIIEKTIHHGPMCRDNISDEKQKVLTRIATIKYDGTLHLDFGDNEDETIHFEDAFTQDPYEECISTVDFPDRPPMQIAILIVGTRGDVQPFLAIAKRLKELGHRVRLATHANFKEFVLDAGVEFYPLGGDPKVLAEYMVKNKGFLPSHPSEVHMQRNQIKDIVFSVHSACTKPDPVTGASFKVDAIIANPPAYGHEHVAEVLKVPLHIFFTMPWTPTGEFPHPLSRVKHPPGPVGHKVVKLSYHVVDLMIWLGIRDIINDFRKTELKTDSVGFYTVSEKALETPHGYIWSPSIVPKPKDWGPKVDVVGFCFLDLASNYTPPEPLVKWLEAGEKPIYIGFGSLPVEEPEKLTETIVKALKATRQRGIINKGWGGLGILKEPTDFVYLLDNVPHDWLFLQCKAVVHHGGAGTTAAGLKAACPTTVVPFFGDQQFWGEMVHARGVGPEPIPIEEFNEKALIEAIYYMMDPKVKEKANVLAKAMESEDGVTGAVNAFFKHLPPSLPSPSPAPVQEEESLGLMGRLFEKLHIFT